MMAPVVIRLLEGWGWTPTLLAIGLGGCALMLCLIPWYQRAPESLARRRGSLDDDAWVAERLEAVRLWNVRNQMRRTYAFWMLPVIHGLGCGGHSIVLTFIVDYYMFDGGWNPVSAALLLTVIQLCCVPSRLLAPLLAEYVEGRLVMSAVLLLQAAPVALFWYADAPWLVYLAAGVFGLAFGGESSVYVVINRKYFGYGPPSNVYGRQMLGSMVGSSIGVVLSGLLIDFMGFQSGLMLSLVLSLAGAAAVWRMESTARVLVDEDAVDVFPPAEAQPSLVGRLAGWARKLG